MRRDIMVDLETLGTTTDSTVFQIAAAEFDITTGQIHSTFNMCCDISKGPVTASGSTIKWWLNTNKELMAKLLSEGTVSEQEMFERFYQWMKVDDMSETFFWGNGILFDNNFVRDKMKQFGMQYPIFYRNDRDVRTILELAAMKRGVSEKELRKEFEIENMEAHNAMDDVRYQVNYVHHCWKILM